MHDDKVQERVSFRCRTDPDDKVSVYGAGYVERVYIHTLCGGQFGDISLPPNVARALAAAIIKSADWAEGKCNEQG